MSPRDWAAMTVRARWTHDERGGEEPGRHRDGS
jgi:hypothetical protein